MKRIILLSLVFFSCFMAFAFTFDVTADAFVASDFLLRKADVQGSVELSAFIENDFQLRVPLRLTYKRGVAAFEGSLNVAYYPFSKGLFFSLSLVDMACVYNMTDRRMTAYTLNEIAAGWTFVISERFIVEPSVNLRDPSGTFSTEYGELKGIFSSYKSIRVRLMCGYRIFKEKQI